MILQTLMKRCLLALLSLNIIGTSALSLAGNNYTVVEQEYLKTFAAPQARSSALDIKNIETTQLPISPETHHILSDYEQRAIALSMLAQLDDQPQATVIDTKFVKKMELICGGGDAQQHLLAQINNTHTVFGELALAKILTSPTRSIETINNRQLFINDLLIQEGSQEHLDIHFNKMKQLQSSVFSYWQEESAATIELNNRLYFSSALSFLNKSTVALEGKARLRNIGTALMLALPVLPNIGTKIYQKGKKTELHDIGDAIADYAKSFYPYTINYSNKTTQEINTDFTNGLPAVSLGDQFALMDAHVEASRTSYMDLYQTNIDAYNNIEKNRVLTAVDLKERQLSQDKLNEFSSMNVAAQTKPIKVVIGLGKGLITAITLWQVKKAIQEAQLNTVTTNIIHERLIAVASYIQEIKTIHERLACLEHSDKIPACDVLEAFFNGTAPISQDAKDLLSMLDSNTFKGSPSFFTITGRVLSAHTLMNQVKNELAPLFEAAGQLEAYCSIAKLYADHLTTKSHYCFVEFVDSTKPYIQANGFWNPFIDANSVVTNDIEINNAVIKHNIILTGPNTGGKSTIIKAVAINLLLAQSFGIAAADSMTLTPFSVINCYLNITDDISSGTSLFHAEVLRAKELINQVKNLPSEQFCFTILDEVFSGTNAEGGSQSAYQFAHELGQFQNTMLVIATHFENMTELEKTSSFTNMSVTAKVMPNGKIVRPFKLKSGAFSDPKNTVLKALLEQEGIFESTNTH